MYHEVPKNNKKATDVPSNISNACSKDSQYRTDSLSLTVLTKPDQVFPIAAITTESLDSWRTSGKERS
jgi:hypothetical protein